MKKLSLKKFCELPLGEHKILFGKYKGTMYCDLPANYLMYLHRNEIPSGKLKEYIDKNLQAIKKQIEDGNGEV